MRAEHLVHPVSVELTEPDGPTRLVGEAISAYGRLDILVKNVGAVRPRIEGFLSITDDDWSSTVAPARGGQPDAVADQAARDAVTGRFTQPQEVADLVLLLASYRAGNVTAPTSSSTAG